MSLPTIVIIPGNGNSRIEHDNWYASLRDSLKGRGYPVVATDMPDAELARRRYWEPYLENELIKDAQSIVVGHSSGAVATLRYLEKHSLEGAILVGCNYTDMGMQEERESGWYDEPWDWPQIKSHADWITQFASPDDPYIPMEEVQHIHRQLGTELISLPGRGHFMVDHSPLNHNFPEILKHISNKTS